MNYLLDSNILLYAKMSSIPENLLVSEWLEEVVSNPNNTINVCETSILSFLRIATNDKIFNPGLTSDETEKFLDSFLSEPNVNLVYSSKTHYLELTKLMDKYDFRGNLVMDANLAVFALSIGATLVTQDKDFAKIPYLKTLNPLKI